MQKNHSPAGAMIFRFLFNYTQHKFGDKVITLSNIMDMLYPVLPHWLCFGRHKLFAVLFTENLDDVPPAFGCWR